MKLNAATVLREDALFKKKQEKEAAIIKAYESDLRDASEYLRWQTEARKADEGERKVCVCGGGGGHRPALAWWAARSRPPQAAIERRRLEMAASAHEAIEARCACACVHVCILCVCARGD